MAVLIRLDARLMRAALALLREGQRVKVVYIGHGVQRECWIVSEGAFPGTALLMATVNGVNRYAQRPVAYHEIGVPEETLTQMERALRRLEAEAFIAQAKQFKARATSRDALGRYQDSFHRSEPAGAKRVVRSTNYAERRH